MEKNRSHNPKICPNADLLLNIDGTLNKKSRLNPARFFSPFSIPVWLKSKLYFDFSLSGQILKKDSKPTQPKYIEL